MKLKNKNYVWVKAQKSTGSKTPRAAILGFSMGLVWDKAQVGTMASTWAKAHVIRGEQ